MDKPTQSEHTSKAVRSALEKIDDRDLSRALGRVREESDATPDSEFYIPRDRAGALLQSAMQEHLDREATREAPVSDEFLFSNGDPGWITVVGSLLGKWLTRDAEFRTHEDHAVEFAMPDNARVALFSDWGTGQPAGLQVMETIVANKPDIVIHLGDIYYSGQPHEARKHFLRHLPPKESGVRRFALNANHEMYSGGHGYFDDVLGEMEHKASYFSLANSHFRLVGLDSAHKDKRLRKPQPEWLEDLVGRGSQRNILLSHHQAFSVFEEVDPDDLWEPIRPLAEKGLVHAWFWGHEHKNVLFRKYKGVAARCIGHGAVPYLPPGRDLSPTLPELGVKFVNRRRRTGGIQCVNGFALLRFQGPDLDVDYIDEDGVVAFTESLSNVIEGISD
jgi:hypothetical protein